MSEMQSTNLPPPPSAGVAPGQQSYNGSHMPPPLSIPQNMNPVPSAVSSPMGNNGLTSPSSAGPRRAAPEPNKRALYVGGLDPRVTEEVLKQIFETTGHVQNVKIIPDKNVRPESPVSQYPKIARARRGHTTHAFLVFIPHPACHFRPAFTRIRLNNSWSCASACLFRSNPPLPRPPIFTCALLPLSLPPSPPPPPPPLLLFLYLLLLLTTTADFIVDPVPGQGVQLRVCRVRRSPRGRKSHANPERKTRPPICTSCHDRPLYSPSTLTCQGNPRQLGLPVQQQQQGRHVQPLPHLCRRPFQRGQR